VAILILQKIKKMFGHGHYYRLGCLYELLLHLK